MEIVRIVTRLDYDQENKKEIYHARYDQKLYR